MKIWLKLLIGSILGMFLGIMLPSGNQSVMDRLSWLNDLAIRIGSYVTLPILFFSLTIAIYELRQDGRFWGILFRTFLVMLGCAAFVIAAGIFVTLTFPPARIPILIEEQVKYTPLDTAGSILELFPSNMFSALTNSGAYLLPAVVFAYFLGMGLSYDKTYSKPVTAILDSLSRIFYYIASFFSEILALALIILSAYWAVQFNGVLQAEVFRDLILLLGIFCGVLAFLILPLFLFLLKPTTNPWAAIYGSLGQAIGAFFSGNINFSLPVMFRHVKENLGVRRRSGAVTGTLFAAFGRAGSAAVAAASFIVIIKSYSSLDLTLADIFSIGGRALLLSFLLARHPGDGAYTALAALCLAYGRGFEAGYLILKPLAFYLIAAGTFLDVMIASLASYGIAKMSGFQEDKSLRHFI